MKTLVHSTKESKKTMVPANLSWGEYFLLDPKSGSWLDLKYVSKTL